MLSVTPTWHSDADTPEQIGLVRHALADIVASHAFFASKRSQDFLKLIVEHALQGEIDSLRERMIGAEMFGRPVDYDTGSDSVVRVKATDVRKKLAQYYLELTAEPVVRIELPSGSYVPRFIFSSLEDSSVTIHPLPASPVEPLAHAAHQPAAQTARPSPVSLQPEDAPKLLALPPAFGRAKRPVLTIAILAAMTIVSVACLLIFRKGQADPGNPAEIRSIAILPLKNLSGDPAQEYFADGMTEELINDLGQVATLRVISLTSAMSYKGTRKKLPEIAKELAVTGVVEGGVLREGNQVRISTQLIDSKTDRPIWAHTYVRDLANSDSWQGEVAQAIADEISINVTPQQQARLARRRMADPEAEDFYLHGMLNVEADDCKSAINYFLQAIAKNPNYAEAHAALANCYGRLGESGHIAYRTAFSNQKAEAARAIELDEMLAEGHAELANTDMTLDWDWKAAATEFQRALELNPNSAAIHESYSFYLMRTGQSADALAEVQHGLDLDPVSGRSLHYEGFIYYFSHQYDQALSLIRRVRALELAPPDWSFLLGDVYAEKGMYAESIAEFLKSGNGPDSLGHLGNAYARAGKQDAALITVARLEQNVKDDGVGRYEIALVYAGLGNKQEAFKWLEEAYRAQDVGLVYLKVDPCLDPLRTDPHFDDLIRRVGLKN